MRSELASRRRIMRIVGLDIGTKRIGIAVSDESELLAQPLVVYRCEGVRRRDLAGIAAKVREVGAGRVVIGLPLNLNGSSGPAAQRARRFADELAALLAIPIETWDERLSTAAVERTLIAADVRREKRRQVIDKLAAAYILQGYLDAKRSTEIK